MTSKKLPVSSISADQMATIKHQSRVNTKRSLLAVTVVTGLLIAASGMAQESPSSTTDSLSPPTGVTTHRYERASEVWRQMLPEIEHWTDETPSQDSMPITLSRLAFENVFVQLWTRPELSLRDRSLVTISMLVAQGSEKELALHVASGLRNGLTPEEIEEVVYQATAYASFPRASQAAAVVGRVLAQERQDQERQ